MQYHISEHPEYMLVETRGKASLEGFMDMTASIRSHRAWQPGGAVIFDHSELDMTTLPRQAISEIAFATIGRARLAVVCSRPLNYGLTRVWLAQLDAETQQQCRLFASRDEARAWIRGDNSPEE